MFKQITYQFSTDKNQQLIKERGISFEEIIAAIDNHQLLDVLRHPNQQIYPQQKMYVVHMNDYAYLVPFIEKDLQTIFLKTAFASRKATKRYLLKEDKA